MTKTLKARLVRLTKDIANPNFDKRRRHGSNARPMFLAGTAFILQEFEEEVCDQTVIKSTLWAIGMPDYYDIYPGTDIANLGKLILGAVEDTEPRTILEACSLGRGCGCGSVDLEVFKRLLKEGKFTLADVVRVADEIQNEED